MNETALSEAQRLLADVWDMQRRCTFTAMQVEGRIDRLPDLSFDAAADLQDQARTFLARIDRIDRSDLPDATVAGLCQARYACELRRHAADWYWLVLDPVGVGFFGLFLPSAYCGGFILNAVFNSLAVARFAKAGDLDRQLGLASDLAALVDQMTERTVGQAERGILMPKAQIPAARALIAGFRTRARNALTIDASRLAPALHIGMKAFASGMGRRVGNVVEPAFDRLAEVFDAAYEERAPQAVGMGQYAGGAEVYRALIGLHTTLEKSPEQIHAEGLRRLFGIEADMRALRAEAGFADDPEAYLERCRQDPRFSASTPEAVASVFQRYIDRMANVFDRAFHAGPRAAASVAPLPDALQKSMTFGYYDAAKPGSPAGRFLFNSSHLTRTALHNVAALTYHELVPGHHLHVSMQQENPLLHPLGRFAFCNAYNEGWAEYAATLAGELGLYAEPEERYGRCTMDAFLTSRLVVDTGMNAFGWSLERARTFMREHGAMSEAEIASETLRYSCDMPAQALAYKLGDTEILSLRTRMQSRLGERFDIRDFHAAVLRYGAMPLADLAACVDAH